jgi:hypothetical protein
MSEFPLLDVISAARAAEGTTLDALTVLTAGRDPFRICDGAAGRWFAEQKQRFPAGVVIHIRGLFYLVVGAGDIPRPNGKLFTNTETNWNWFVDQASKAARWLNLIGFNDIIDMRNDRPEIFPAGDDELTWNLIAGFEGYIPGLWQAMPRFVCPEITARQPVRLVLIGEKSSLGNVLRPVARRTGGEMVLGAGELSDTLIYGAVRRAAEDGRQTVVLYLSDYDPSGNQMPCSVARKIQAFRYRDFPDLSLELRHVGLTRDQVEEFDLPGTPLKTTEARAEKWIKRHPKQQVEIDAMIALRPEALRQITENAAAPFWDPDLQDRIDGTREEWIQETRQWLEKQSQYIQAKTEIETALDAFRQAGKALKAAQDRAAAALRELEPPELDQPEAQLSGEAPLPLFDTDDDFITASLKLIAYKNGEGGE